MLLRMNQFGPFDISVVPIDDTVEDLPTISVPNGSTVSVPVELSPDATKLYYDSVVLTESDVASPLKFLAPVPPYTAGDTYTTLNVNVPAPTQGANPLPDCTIMVLVTDDQGNGAVVQVDVPY